MKRFITLIGFAEAPMRRIQGLKKIYTCLLLMVTALTANASDYYLIGEFNGWTLKQNDCKFTENWDGNTYVLDLQGTLTSGFKINDGTWSNPSANFGGTTTLTPGESYTLEFVDDNITMENALLNPHIEFDPDNMTLLVTGQVVTGQIATQSQPMVALEHEGDLSFYTDLRAFESALKDAQNGDILYLTEGDFYISEGKVTINKRVSVVGSGYSSHLSGNILIDMSSNPDSYNEAPLFDGVRLDKVSFATSDAAVNNIVKSEIRRCWIAQLTDVGFGGEEVLINSCRLDYGNFTKPTSSESHIELRNSKIGGADSFYNCNMVLNCNVASPDCFPETMISCIIDNFSENNGYGGYTAIYGSMIPVAWNTVFTEIDGGYKDLQKKDCYYESYALDDNLEYRGYEEFRGLDGTVVGVYGGESPFSMNPSVPTVNTRRSAVEYDAENNKLKVSIVVIDN